MKIKVQLVFEDDVEDSTRVQEIAQLQRDALSPTNLGLTLAEAKALLRDLQRYVVTSR